MNKKTIRGFRLAGLALKTKTSNENGRSQKDCGNLWQAFEKGNYAEAIPDKLGDEVYAVYYNYEGDHSQPFSYFIGCKVRPDAKIPEGMDSLCIPEGTYQQFLAKGEMTGCIADAWKEIWAADERRAYKTDFEVYGEKSRDWKNAEVEIYCSVL
jgi:predicted transcriptional regulator YdeE